MFIFGVEKRKNETREAIDDKILNYEIRGVVSR